MIPYIQMHAFCIPNTSFNITCAKETRHIELRAGRIPQEVSSHFDFIDNVIIFPHEEHCNATGHPLLQPFIMGGEQSKQELQGRLDQESGDHKGMGHNQASFNREPNRYP